MREINRKEYGLRKKDLGIDWVVNYLAVDTCNVRVWAYNDRPIEDGASWVPDKHNYHNMSIDMQWPFGDATIARVVK